MGGWDTNREVVYFQTSEQQQRDDRKRHPPKSPEAVRELFEKRKAIVAELFSSGLRVSQIALVLNQPESLIKDDLCAAE